MLFLKCYIKQQVFIKVEFRIFEHKLCAVISSETSCSWTIPAGIRFLSV